MLYRSVLSGIVLGIIILAVFVVIIDNDCGTVRGCVDFSGVSEKFDDFMTHFTDEDSAAKLVKTKRIPSVRKVEKKDTPRDQLTELARIPVPPPNARPPVQVDSLSAEDHYDILKWNAVAYQSGNVDVVRTANGIVPKDGGLAVSRGDYVILSGWAGHRAYGIRFQNVLFSMCGKVVGRTAVEAARPDVASAVHRNLTISGWSAKLAADHLPRCKNQELQTWGVAPIGYSIFPLTGTTVLSFAETAAGATGSYRTRASLLTPERNGKAVLKKIIVRAAALRLRKCGDTGCDVVGRMQAGQHNGFVLETAGGWTLFQVGEAVGWASNKYLSVQ